MRINLKYLSVVAVGIGFALPLSTFEAAGQLSALAYTHSMVEDHWETREPARLLSHSQEPSGPDMAVTSEPWMFVAYTAPRRQHVNFHLPTHFSGIENSVLQEIMTRRRIDVSGLLGLTDNTLCLVMLARSRKSRSSNGVFLQIDMKSNQVRSFGAGGLQVLLGFIPPR